MTITPEDNRVGVRLDSPVKVSVSDGSTLTRVRVTTPDGRTVKGKLNSAKTGWTSLEALSPDTVYRVSVNATNPDGAPRHVTQTFSTMAPRRVLATKITPEQGSRVGVGMPIVLSFDSPVTNKVDVEKRLDVETSVPIEGAWSWVGDSEIHYRPRTYWPPKTQVTVSAKLRGVDAGKGVWGTEDLVRNFRIVDRSVVTKVDLVDHHARVYIDNKLARTIPVTGGMPGWETRNGTKVVLEKQEYLLFTNEAIGAPEEYELTSRWGLRLTWTGEFIHDASWSVGSHGYANVSHGCVGMNLENTEWLWKHSTVGDPVEVKSPDGDQMPVTGNGYGDWNVPWKAWKAGSALS
ncbi:MAG TPA: Ig-like domain-containing protein [Actinopolymorphaceae bacterium]